MSRTDDSASVPLLSPPTTTTTTATALSSLSSSTLSPNGEPMLGMARDPPSKSQDAPPTAATSESTKVFVRKHSRKTEQTNKGSVATFTVTKVKSESAAVALVPGPKSFLPPPAEEPNEQEESSPPTVAATPSHFQPSLKKSVGSNSHKYLGQKRVRHSVDFSTEELPPPARQPSDRSRSSVTVDSGIKSLLKASQTDVSEAYKSPSSTIDRDRQISEVARRGRLFAKRKKFRLVHQTGECNILYVNVDKRGARFLLDIFTTLVALPWRYNILVYLVSFLLSWMLFALVWWGLHIFYGVDDEGTPCMEGVVDFTSAFLFSIETQHTIGYGSRHITTRCPPAVCLLILQSVFGAIMQCVVTGIVFAKLSRPNQRAETVMFSKKAVVCMDKDGRLCLEFRVGDMRRSQLIGVSINTVLVQKVQNIGRRAIQLEQECLRTTTEANRHHDEDLDGFYFLAWPIKIIHRIDDRSPLYYLSPNDLLVANFEIVVVLEATCEATGATIQVRTSYLPSEILWGHTLVSLVTYQKDNGRFKVDYSHFDEVKPVHTPEKSAADVAKDRSKRKKMLAAADSVEFLDETQKNYDCVKSPFYSKINSLSKGNSNSDTDETPTSQQTEVSLA